MGLLCFTWFFLVMAAVFGWLGSSSWALLTLPHVARGLALLLCWLPPPGSACGAGGECRCVLQERMPLFAEV